MCIHMAGSLVVQQKLTQHCKETIFHFFKRVSFHSLSKKQVPCSIQWTFNNLTAACGLKT